MQIGQVFLFLLGRTYKWYQHIPIKQLEIGLFFRRRELSVLSGSSAWLNLNYHFSLRFYFEGDSSSRWYRTVSMKQLLLISFWENKITSWSIVKWKNKQIWTGYHGMKLFRIQIGGYRVNSAKTRIWFIAIKKPNILLNSRDIENILCLQ